MKSEFLARPYDNSSRARQSVQTTERIISATELLLIELPLASVTLKAIAARAEVTVQTVIRKLGSRDGCFAAVRERVTARVEAQRPGTDPGNADAAIAQLIEHYEAEGRLVLQLLSQESSEDFAQSAAEEGRAYHRSWVQTCFGATDDATVDALVAATDLYVWKLLRLDLGRSAMDTSATMHRLVRAILETA